MSRDWSNEDDARQSPEPPPSPQAPQGNSAGLLARAGVLVALVAAAFAAVATRVLLNDGNAVPRPGWFTIAVHLLLALAVLRYGVEVRRYRRGTNRTPLNPLRAARTAALAQAAVLAGSLFAGVWAAPLLFIVRELTFANNGAIALRLLAGVLSALVIVVTGFVVHSWCRVGGHPTSSRQAQ